MFGWFKKKDGGCAHRTDLTPEEDIQIAEAEYRAGNLVHAAYHAGCALSRDPTRAEWLAVLDRISDVSPDPLQLAPIQEKNYFATMAVRAYLLHRLNRRAEGMNLLLQAVLAKPDVPYLRWAIQWVQEPGAVGQVEGPVTQFLLRVINEKLALWQQGTEAAGATQELLPVLIQAVRRTGTGDPHVLFLGASVLRRTGHVAEALDLAQGAYQIQPCWEFAVAVANAQRELGRMAEAYDAFQKALELRPDEASVHLDMGDMMWDQSNWDRAAYHYGEALRADPQDAWALPSSYAVQCRKTGDERWKESLRQLAQAGNERAQYLLWQLGMDLETYVPEATEATINVARQLIEDFAQRPHEIPDSEVEVTLSALEPPSALAAASAEFRAAGWPQAPTFKVEKVGKPDPRRPYGQVDYILWTYQGNNPHPGYPPAAPQVAAAVSRLATQEYRMSQWSQWGRGLAQELGPVPVEQLLGAMIHPPAGPAGVKAWDWAIRCQLAAAFIIAGRQAGWAGTERRRVLLSLARGPLDWSVEAALIALAAIAKEEPSSVPEIAELHLDRYRGTPDEGAVCWMPTLCLSALNRPGIQDDERAHWQDILQQL